MRPALALFILSAFACSERSLLLVPELPTEIAWVGALYPEAPDQPGSGLFPIVDGRVELSLSLPPDVEEIQVVAFTERDLDRYTPPSGAELESGRLLAEVSGHALMQPSFSATGLVSDGSSLERDDQPPMISAQWRPPCADLALDTEKLVSVACLGNPCAARATQTGCRFVLDAPGCGLRLEASVEAGKLVGFAPESPASECRWKPGSHPTELGCEGPGITDLSCPMTLLAFEWEAPAIEHTRVEVVPETPGRERFAGFGYLLGLERHGSMLVTLSGGGEPLGDSLCAETATWQFADLETLAITQRAPAPECPRAFDYDEREPGLLLVHGSTVSRVTRFDVTGQAIRSVELPPPLQLPDWRPNALFVEPTSRAVVIPLAPVTPDPDEDNPDWFVLVLDADTLELRGAPLKVRRLTQLMFQRGPGLVAVPHGDFTLSTLNTYGVTLSEGISIGAVCGPAGKFWDGFFDAARNRFVLSGRGGANHGITQLDVEGGGGCIRAFPIESVRNPFGIAPWPANPSLLVTGLDGVRRDSLSLEAAIAFFDLEHNRFLLGEVPIGLGHVKHIQPDGTGGVVMILPGQASIARVRPAR